MLKIYGLTADRAQLLTNKARADDIEAARLIADLYIGRGLIARICRESATGRGDELLDQFLP